MKDMKKYHLFVSSYCRISKILKLDIENTQIGYDMLMPDERREVRMQLEFLYQRRAELKRALRKEG